MTTYMHTPLHFTLTVQHRSNTFASCWPCPPQKVEQQLTDQHRQRMEVQQTLSQLQERTQMLTDASPVVASAWQDICSGKVRAKKSSLTKQGGLAERGPSAHHVCSVYWGMRRQALAVFLLGWVKRVDKPSSLGAAPVCLLNVCLTAFPPIVLLVSCLRPLSTC